MYIIHVFRTHQSNPVNDVVFDLWKIIELRKKQLKIEIVQHFKEFRKIFNFIWFFKEFKVIFFLFQEYYSY